MLNDTNTITDALNAIAQGMDDMLTLPATKPVGRKTSAPKAKTTKPKPIVNQSVMDAMLGVPVDAMPTPKAKPEPVAKPAPATIDGIALKEGTDAATVQAATAIALDAVSAIVRKDEDLLLGYLALGGFQSNLKTFFASTKLSGQYVAKAIPDSAKLDPALRSNCTWLFEACNGFNDASDILSVLAVNDIASFKSANPTVIRREYKAKKDALAKKIALAESGIDVDDEEAIADAEAKAKETDKAKQKAARELADKAVAWLIVELNNMTAKKKRQEQLTAILVPSLTGSNDAREGALSLVIDDYLAAMEEAESDTDSDDTEE